MNAQKKYVQRSTQFHERAQGWSRWASWTTELWLKIGTDWQSIVLGLATTPCFPVSGERVIALFTYIILPPQIFDPWNGTWWVDSS